MIFIKRRVVAGFATTLALVVACDRDRTETRGEISDVTVAPRNSTLALGPGAFRARKASHG